MRVRGKKVLKNGAIGGYLYYPKDKKWKWRIIGTTKKQKGGVKVGNEIRVKNPTTGKPIKVTVNKVNQNTINVTRTGNNSGGEKLTVPITSIVRVPNNMASLKASLKMIAMKNKIHGTYPIKHIGQMLGLNTRNRVKQQDPNKLYLQVEVSGSGEVLIRSLGIDKNATVKDLYELIHQILPDKKDFILFKGYSTNYINSNSKKVKNVLGNNNLVTLMVKQKPKLYIGYPNHPYFAGLHKNSFQADSNFNPDIMKYTYPGVVANNTDESSRLDFIVLVKDGDNDILYVGIEGDYGSNEGSWFTYYDFVEDSISSDFASRLIPHMTEFNGDFNFEYEEKPILTLNGNKFILGKDERGHVDTSRTKDVENFVKFIYQNE